MTDREQEARAEAYAQGWGEHPGLDTTSGVERRRFARGFLAGVGWADAHRSAEPDEDNWEYGCANFGDLDDVMTVPGPLALKGKTGRKWAKGVLQPEYGDLLVRRRPASKWEPVTLEGEQP